MQVCPSCGEENPAKFRVCGYCGTSLAPALPAQEERKTVTIVFSDLVGSTSLAERVDPEALHHVLTRYFEVMSGVLQHHGGRIEKFIGDAIVAVFGLPRVHEDDAVRAVRAAYEMQQSLGRLNDELMAAFGVTIQARIGVNTGEVVTGDATTGQSLVTGDTANVAARLEQAAPAMEVFISRTTLRLVREVVEVEPMEPLELKGKAKPVPAYRLLGMRGMNEWLARRFDTPMVGRETELAALHAAFGRAVLDLRCHAVTVLGDAGVGKSRLIRELIASVRDDARVLRGRCLSYGEGITFWPLAEIAHEAAGLANDESQGSAIEKLIAVIGDPEIVERLASAIGLSDVQLPMMELFWGVRRFLETLARDRPLVVVIDDIHWAEPTFLDLIEHLTDSLELAPVLILMTARPDLLEARPGWGDGPCSTRIVLEPLARDQSEAVVENLLGQAGLPTRLRDRVVRAAGGNPLFVEQLLSMLIDDGLVRAVDGRWEASAEIADQPIPPSIQALLAARLDRLIREERAVIEPAAVIGIEFPEPAIVSLAPEPVGHQVDVLLEGLTLKQMIQPAAGLEDAYRFNHQLIRDAAYQAMLKRGRATLHEAFAEWLQEQEAERIGEFEEVIAYHLEQAHLYLRELAPLDEHSQHLAERASGLLGESGRRAFAREDFPAAVGLLRRAAALLPGGTTEQRAMQLLLTEALDELGAFAEAEALLNDVEGSATAAGDEASAARARLLRLRLELATTPGPDWAVRALTEADRDIPIFDALGDYAGGSLAWRLRSVVHATACLWSETAADAQRVIELAGRAQDARQRLRGISNLAVAVTYGPTPVPEAIQQCEALAAEVGADRLTAAVLTGFLGQLYAMRGEFGEGRERVDGARRTVEEMGQRVHAASLAVDLAEVELRAEDPAAAESALRAASAALEEFGETYVLATVAGLLGRALLERGNLDEAEAESRRAEQLAAADDLDANVRWRSLRASVAARRGSTQTAVQLAQEAVELSRGAEAPLMTAGALAVLAEALQEAGDEAASAEALTEAVSLYEAKGDAVSAERVRAALSGSAPTLRANRAP